VKKGKGKREKAKGKRQKAKGKRQKAKAIIPELKQEEREELESHPIKDAPVPPVSLVRSCRLAQGECS
jgi:hypothetical protein